MHDLAHAHTTARGAEYRYRMKTRCSDDVIRVVIWQDVIALPSAGWAGEHFGPSISVDWLLTQAKLPGPKRRREQLARAIVMALDEHHGRNL